MPATVPSFQDHFIEQPSLQVLPLCWEQRHTPSPWEIAVRRTSRKQLKSESLS